MGEAGYSDDNTLFALHTTMFQQYQAVAQQLGVDFVPSVTPGFNDQAVRSACVNNSPLARRTSATAAEDSVFSTFLGLAIPYATNGSLKMIHINTFNEWGEDTQVEPSIVTQPTTFDDSPTGSQYTEGFVYQGYSTTYLDIVRNQIAAAKR